MSKYIMQAKMINTLAKFDFNNSDRVLSLILTMISEKEKLSSKNITLTTMRSLRLKETNVRKIMSELKLSGVIIKEGDEYIVNPKYLKQ